MRPMSLYLINLQRFGVVVTVVCDGDVTPLSGQTSHPTITSTGLQLSFSSLGGGGAFPPGDQSDYLADWSGRGRGDYY